MKCRIALLTLLALAGAQAQASTVTYNTGGVDANVPSLTGFATNGDEMDGMEVTATFANGFVETIAWADTGPAAGGVTGTGWNLSVSGDTFSDLIWAFNFTDDNLILSSLALDGPSGFTVFDRTDPSPGTAGSAQGKDYVDNLAASILADVTYSNAVGIGGAAPVGDLWNNILIDYSRSQDGGVAGTSFLFSQDTDTDIRAQVPAPGTAALLGLALAAFGAARRKA